MMRLRLAPDNTKIDFMGIRKITVGLSIVAFVGSIILAIVSGLNFGIDFKGGIMIEMKTEQPADLAQIRSIANGLNVGDVSVQEFGQPDDVLLRIGAKGDGDAQMATVDIVKKAMAEEIPGVDFRRVEVVGPKVSGELVWEGVLSIGLAVFAVLVYIWLRFEWQFSVGAVVALIHDVTLTIGVFSLLQIQFNLSIIAALLTIIGYSLNDTVVVFDRIRENLRKYKKMPITELINLSINETLARTLATSFTTLLALFALFYLGGETISGFTFAMIWGIFVGTYSSIFVAAVALVLFDVKRDWSDPDAKSKTKGPSGTNFNGAQV